MAEMECCHQCLWKSHVFHRPRGAACQVMHLICTTTKTYTSAKTLSTGLVFRLFLFPFFPFSGSTSFRCMPQLCSLHYPSVLKAHMKMTLTNIIFIATCVICKVRVIDDLINHEYLFLIISNIHYALSKEDFVVRFVYWSSYPEWE